MMENILDSLFVASVGANSFIADIPSLPDIKGYIPYIAGAGALGLVAVGYALVKGNDRIDED